MNATVPARGGVSREVVLAAVATALGVLPLVPGFTRPTVPTWALYGVGWAALGLVAAILLDREPGSRVGWTLALLATTPAVMALVAALLLAGSPTAGQLADLARRADLGLVLAALGLIAWAVGLPSDRMSRRRLAWLVIWSCVLVAALTAAGLLASSRTLALVTTLGLWCLGGLVLRLVVTREFRPLDEPLVDAAAVLATLLLGASIGTGVRVAAVRVGDPVPDLSAALAAAVCAALAWPAALWLRRGFLERRYGSGTLTQADVAAITADLHCVQDPRELLGKAATMIAAASGHREVRLVVGEDDPDSPAEWFARPLVVAGDRVGTLLLRPSHPEGPEPRQERIVQQMLPTVALMTRAVALAVEAEQARRDVSRERDAERARILGDLHDGLGPGLAGMSMRVAAELRTNPTPLLDALSAELADSRDDLRRIVSGLTPSALHDTDLAEALAHLAESFDGTGRRVALTTALTRDPAPAVAVAVYRSVAEGVTNAFRHGHAALVTVHVRSTGEQVDVEVLDDGTGGPIVPGVGLTSLRTRAEQLGGTLTVVPATPTGVRLRVGLPTQGAA